MRRVFTRSISMAALVLLSAQLTSGQVPRHGIEEFDASGTFEVPTGVTEIVVELWGAGGGGGGGRSAGLGAGPGGSGGGGGSGAYVRAIVPVKGGETYSLIIGAGGRGGTGESKDVAHAGVNGEETVLRIETRTLLSAKGGQRGRLATADGRVGEGGAGGEATVTAWMLVRSGNKGFDGQRGEHTEWNSVPGGVGGAAIVGTLASSGSFGGSGGSGGVFGQGGGNGADGGRGFAIISW